MGTKLYAACSEILGSPELRLKREHENKTFSFFTPRSFSRTFYFLVFPTIWKPDRLQFSLGIYYTECLSDLKL